MKRIGPVRLGTLCVLALLGSLGVWSLASPARSEGEAPVAVIDLWLDGRRVTETHDALIAATALAPDQDVRVREVGRDAHASHHVVGIRTGEALHRHDRHDLVVVVLRGHGTMRLGAETRPVGQGSVLYVPRGLVHAFSNGAGESAPSFAYVVYSPPFDGRDRIPVDEAPAP